MSELPNYLGSQIISDIKSNICKDIKEFNKQSGATKLELANQNHFDLCLYKEGTKHLINALDDSAAEIDKLEENNKILDEEVTRFQKKYGEVNEDFIKKRQLNIVVKTEEKSHARKYLEKYVKKYENQKNGENITK